MKTKTNGRKTRGNRKARATSRRAPNRRSRREPTAAADEKTNRSMQSFELV